MNQLFLLFQWIHSFVNSFLQWIHSFASCLMAVFLFIVKFISFSRPGIRGIAMTILIFAGAFILAVLCNRYLVEKVTDVDRLTFPVMLESSYFDLGGGFNITTGFNIAYKPANESFFRISNNNNETLFEILFFTEKRDDIGTHILEPNTCTAIKVRLPSKQRLQKSLLELSDKIDDSQAIYEICKYRWPFQGVIQPRIFLDRQSLLELLKQEFSDAIKEKKGKESQEDKEDKEDKESKESKEGKEDKESKEGKESKEDKESKEEKEGDTKLSLAKLNENQQIAVKDVYLGQFLSIPGILGDNFQTNNNKCGNDESILDRICDTQAAMFTNGPIQFVSLVVFMFGLVHLVLLFILAVVAPWWFRVSAFLLALRSNESATVVPKFLNLPRFTQLYPELSAPIIAAIEILPMTGFFGTIVGISGAMTEVAGVKSSDKIIEVLALGSMTTNIGVAFETTKFALILSGILLLLKLMTDRAHALSTEE